MHTTIKHHGITFTIDTAYWSDSGSRQVCEDLLIEGVQNLSENEVEMIAKAWRHELAEDESLNNPDCPANKLVSGIQNNAMSVATEQWVSYPSRGHNAFIGIVRPRWRIVSNQNSVEFGEFDGIDETAAIDHMACDAGYKNLADMDVVTGTKNADDIICY